MRYLSTVDCAPLSVPHRRPTGRMKLNALNVRAVVFWPGQVFAVLRLRGRLRPRPRALGGAVEARRAVG